MPQDHESHPISAKPERLAKQQMPGGRSYHVKAYIEHCRRALHELIDIGAERARQVHRQATAQAKPARIVSDMRLAQRAPDQTTGEPQAPAEDPIIAFDRIVGAVRRAIILASKLDEPIQAPARRESQDRNAGRKRMIRAVEDAFRPNSAEDELDGSDEEEDEKDREEEDREEEDREEEDFADRPLYEINIAEVIASIRRDLGVAHVPGKHPGKRGFVADIEVLADRAPGGTKRDGVQAGHDTGASIPSKTE